MRLCNGCACLASVCMLTWNVLAAVLKWLLCCHSTWNVWTIILHEMDNDKYYIFWSLAVPRHVLARWSTATTQDLSIINTLIIEWHREDNPLVKMFTWFMVTHFFTHGCIRDGVCVSALPNVACVKQWMTNAFRTSAYHFMKSVMKDCFSLFWYLFSHKRSTCKISVC
jgi:hypothetical protein